MTLSFDIGIPGLDDVIAVKVTGNTATTIVDGTDEAWFVPWFRVNENTGGTPTLTVDLYDGTTAYLLGSSGGSTYTALAMTAKQSVLFNDGYRVPKGWKLRVTSGDAAGKMEVSGVKARIPGPL